MPGIYGPMLAFFPELLNEYEVFTMSQKIGAGYGPRKTFAKIEGYLSRDSNGTEGIVSSLRTENQKAHFYCEDEIPSSTIKQGLYVEDDGEIFQFIVDNAYAREGGFTMHGLQLVTGNTDKQVPHSRVDLGLDEYK